eukprot:TRINITY_DN1310_c1_g1_i11.p2 TRINITY_DN1310_c1_g1~~TRINITY_DN1310_c1_g1_i11.p2  ORF type:complete len:118 (+),score=10.04 TRINITY_DN1310_c1_g1_i11:51-404(+)
MVKAVKKKPVKKAAFKPFRWRAGTVALREIKHLQQSTELLLQKGPFRRLVRETLRELRFDVRFESDALDAVQEAAESYLIELFEGAVILQLHRGKKSLTWKDLNYTRRIRKEIPKHK